MKIKFANILNAKETYIVHQCNCVSVKPHGLSKEIAKWYPNNCPYERREPLKNRNCAKVFEIPGTIKVFDHVICLFAQFGMGKPFTFNNSKKQLHENDTFEQRKKWFEMCLKQLEAIPGTFALPFKIGCGLAGGNHEQYLKLIKSCCVADRITLYRIE